MESAQKRRGRVRRVAVAKPPITPACGKVLSAILAHYDRGETPTHGKLCKELGRGKRAVSESLRRLEEEDWIERPPYRAGCVREIKLNPSRIVVRKALGLAVRPVARLRKDRQE
jgi:DNA-binding MarR family transcriptional regulator